MADTSLKHKVKKNARISQSESPLSITVDVPTRGTCRVNNLSLRHSLPIVLSSKHARELLQRTPRRRQPAVVAPIAQAREPLASVTMVDRVRGCCSGCAPVRWCECNSGGCFASETFPTKV